VSHIAQSVRRMVSSIRVAPKALFITGTLAATFAGASIAVPATAQASSWLQYQRGYSVQNGWYCYGWANGAYHCTHHWGRAANGRLVSYNTAWVPNYGASHSSAAAARSHKATSAPRPATSATHSGGVSNPGRAGIINEIRSVFGPYGNQALAVAKCESGLNPGARNSISIGGAHAAGLFQILDTSTWYSTSYRNASPYNASANIHAAYEIFHRDGNSWREWSCRP
jgi:transglycosylase-like protein with SLT domain